MTQSFKVIWSHSAVETDLAKFVALAMERGYSVVRINAAMHAIDRVLSRNPAEQGESRSGFERALVVPPLAVVYEIYEDERIVFISKVGYSPRGA